MSRVRRSWAPRCVTGVTLAVALTFVASACSSSGSSSPLGAASPTEATDTETSLEDLDSTALAVRRAPFCDAVDPAAVERALGAEPADVSTYRSGQRIKISDDVADVVHEFGCRWTAGENTAEAWVFAPPVTRRRAAVLAAKAANAARCLDVAGTPDFGRPSSACATEDEDTFSTSYQGLFGDAWLACSLTVGGLGQREVDERASEWCAAVALSAATG